MRNLLSCFVFSLFLLFSQNNLVNSLNFGIQDEQEINFILEDYYNPLFKDSIHLDPNKLFIGRFDSSEELIWVNVAKGDQFTFQLINIGDRSDEISSFNFNIMYRMKYQDLVTRNSSVTHALGVFGFYLIDLHWDKLEESIYQVNYQNDLGYMFWNSEGLSFETSYENGEETFSILKTITVINQTLFDQVRWSDPVGSPGTFEYIYDKSSGALLYSKESSAVRLNYTNENYLEIIRTAESDHQDNGFLTNDTISFSIILIFSLSYLRKSKRHLSRESILRPS